MQFDADISEKVRQWLEFAEEDLKLARHGLTLPGEDEKVSREEALRAIEIAAKVRDIVTKNLIEMGMGLSSGAENENGD